MWFVACEWSDIFQKKRAVNSLTFSLNSLYIFFHWEVLIEIKRPKWEFLSFNAALRRELFFFQSRVSRRNRERENQFSWLRVKKLSSAWPSFSNYDHWHLTPPPRPLQPLLTNYSFSNKFLHKLISSDFFLFNKEQTRQVSSVPLIRMIFMIMMRIRKWWWEGSRLRWEF